MIYPPNAARDLHERVQRSVFVCCYPVNLGERSVVDVVVFSLLSVELLPVVRVIMLVIVNIGICGLGKTDWINRRGWVRSGYVLFATRALAAAAKGGRCGCR